LKVRFAQFSVISTFDVNVTGVDDAIAEFSTEFSAEVFVTENSKAP
jgi:hypothetical protein